MKKIIYTIVCVMLTAAFSGCSSTATNINTNVINKEQGIVLDIMVTNKPLEFMVKDIVGDKHLVDYMFKDENQINDFSFSKDSLDNIGKQDLFIYSGIDFEPWMDDFLSKLDKSHVGVINASRGVKTISFDTKVKYKNKELDKNPYYWLDINDYRVMLNNIKNSIEDKDPQNRDYYEKNFEASLKKLDKYKDQMNKISDKSKAYTFITTSDKFDYLTKSLGLKMIKISGKNSLSPDEKSKLDKARDDLKNLCFLYENDNDLNDNKDIIAAYNLKPVKLTSYNGDLKYTDILKNDFDSLTNAVKD
ncbi:MAG: metal ABC transporter substrate-binding protein [Bacillota bacterium]|nr:metal ABC transporter substrate-binding protein [Bacillota bacterium]